MNSLYAQAILADVPAAWWRGNVSGTSILDSSGNAVNGTGTGTYTTDVTGAIASDNNPAILFAGGRMNPGYAWNSHVGSYECWFNFAANPTNSSLLIGADAGYAGSAPSNQLCVTSAGLLYWNIFDGGYKVITSPSALSFNAWHHAVGTADGTTSRLYLDGAQVASVAAGNMFLYGATPSVFLADCGDGPTGGSFTAFPGKIDEAAVYTTVLSAARVSAHTRAGLTLGNFLATGFPSPI